MAATSAKRTEIIRNEIRDYHRHTRERAVVKGEERDSKVVPTIPRARSCSLWSTVTDDMMNVFAAATHELLFWSTVTDDMMNVFAVATHELLF